MNALFEITHVISDALLKRFPGTTVSGVSYVAVVEDPHFVSAVHSAPTDDQIALMDPRARRQIASVLRELADRYGLD